MAAEHQSALAHGTRRGEARKAKLVRVKGRGGLPRGSLVETTGAEAVKIHRYGTIACGLDIASSKQKTA